MNFPRDQFCKSVKTFAPKCIYTSVSKSFLQCTRAQIISNISSKQTGKKLTMDLGITMQRITSSQTDSISILSLTFVSCMLQAADLCSAGEKKSCKHARRTKTDKVYQLA